MDLSGLNLTPAQSFENANFSSANLSSANFTGAGLTGADLRGANTDGAEFYKADIYGTYYRAKFDGLWIDFVEKGAWIVDGGNAAGDVIWSKSFYFSQQNATRIVKEAPYVTFSHNGWSGWQPTTKTMAVSKSNGKFVIE